MNSLDYIVLEILDDTHSIPAGCGFRYEDRYEAEEAMARFQKINPMKKYEVVYDPE